MFFDRLNGRRLAVPFLVVAEDNPSLGPDDFEPFVVWHFLREIVGLTMMVFDIERRPHFKQSLRKTVTETTVKVKRY